MKQLFKIFAILAISNLIFTVGAVGAIALNTVLPSLEGSDVSLLQFIKGDLSVDEYNLISKNMSENASRYGTEAGEKIVSVLELFYPKKGFTYSDLPPMDYPYPSLNEVIDQNNQIANDGVQQALDIMKQNEDAIQKAKQEGLNILQESEKTNSAIKEQTLSDDNN